MPFEYQNLIYAIFQRTFDDYNHLRKLGVTRNWVKDEGKYSIKEIRDFLRGDWCEALLRSIGADMTGEELITQLKIRNGEWVAS